MAQDEGYNGWSNYATWAMALWIDNDPGTNDRRREILADCEGDRETYYDGTERPLVAQYADALRAEFGEDAAPDLGASVWSDLLGRALADVDWQEIAQSWIED